MATDIREIENRVERVPAAPDRLYVMNSYNVRAGAEAEFEAMWRQFAESASGQDGCEYVRLHRDVDQPARYVTYDLWHDRKSLTGAIRTLGDDVFYPSYPLAGDPRQTFVRLIDHVNGSGRNAAEAEAGQIASLRIFSLKVKSEAQFERLWGASARHEVRQARVLYKRLHRDFNLPTRYVSYSLWADRSAPDEAAQQHDHYQKQHTPYPLVSPVVRSTLAVVANLRLKGSITGGL